MTAADADDDLAIRGYVMARSGTLPTDPSFRALSENDELLAWTYRWYRRVEDDGLAALMRILGVLWTRDDVDRMVNDRESPEAPRDVMVPLAMAVNPELREGLQKIFRVTKGRWIGGGEYRPDRGEEVVELGDLPRDEFLRWAKAAGGVTAGDAQEPASISMGVEQDPRVEKMREQIRASKRFR